MTRSKKIFAGLALVFFLSLVFIIFDISRKTTFPGAKTRLKKAQEKEVRDTKDSVKSSLPSKSAVHQP